MEINFSKYNGAGNDFIIIDDRKSFINDNKSLISYLCDRHFGVGAEGLIILKESNNYDFEILHYTSDGNLGSLCGNGSRCAVLFAYNKDIIGRKTVFNAFDGIHSAEILDNGLIKMEMKVNSDIVINSYGTWLDTGSPHLVIEKDDIDKLDVNNEGRLIRYNDLYKKEGVNVNFIEKISDDQFKIRTYERGVEKETLACGTGSTASAICMNFLSRSNCNNITIKCKGGDLNVQFNSSKKNYKEISITGPAKQVFEGTIKVRI
tara:strand:+ start:1198 stop:1983 length:786 start_codon:yes stop_codon:yes gene_type:complete